MAIGGVTVFGLPPDLPVLVDARVMAREWIVPGVEPVLEGDRRAGTPGALPTVAVVEGLAIEPTPG